MSVEPSRVSVEAKAAMIPKTVERLSTAILALEPGPLAELRRLEPAGPGNAAYWRLASQCGFLDEKADVWMSMVRIMAILSSKGERQKQDKLHDRERGLGKALCDGGDAAWPGEFKGAEPRPAYSEARLARLLAQPTVMRAKTLERIARMLARSRSRELGLNCSEIAHLLARHRPTETLRKTAKDYYRRLDNARAPEKKDQKS
jgi:CRISPR system Cascade subunit CasB